eukprot:44815-Rhodomonas_salina.1
MPNPDLVTPRTTLASLQRMLGWLVHPEIKYKKPQSQSLIVLGIPSAGLHCRGHGPLQSASSRSQQIDMLSVTLVIIILVRRGSQQSTLRTASGQRHWSKTLVKDFAGSKFEAVGSTRLLAEATGQTAASLCPCPCSSCVSSCPAPPHNPPFSPTLPSK